MSTVFIRLILVYFTTVLSIRLMGKRQIGEMQMSELVTTFFLSELASYPITNQNVPLAYGLIPVITLICIEVILSFLSTKFSPVRQALDAAPSALIQKGVLNQTELAQARLTVDELFCQLRLKDIPHLKDVDYALLETNGELSVIKKGEGGMSHLLVADGVINPRGLSGAGLTEADLQDLLQKQNLRLKDTFLFCIDDEKNMIVVPKEGA